MEKVDLALIPLTDLMAELHKRFDIWVFSGMQLRGGEREQIATFRKWGGNSTTCAGLCSQLQIAIYDQHLNSDNVDDDDEPFEP